MLTFITTVPAAGGANLLGPELYNVDAGNPLLASLSYSCSSEAAACSCWSVLMDKMLAQCSFGHPVPVKHL